MVGSRCQLMGRLAGSRLGPLRPDSKVKRIRRGTLQSGAFGTFRRFQATPLEGQPSEAQRTPR
jgi:hypothetical protein